MTLLNNILTLNIPAEGAAFSVPLVTGSSGIVGTWRSRNTAIADSRL